MGRIQTEAELHEIPFDLLMEDLRQRYDPRSLFSLFQVWFFFLFLGGREGKNEI